MSQISKKIDLTAQYQAMGAQKSTLQDYIARQEKAQKKQFKLPPIVKYILITPLVLLCAFGVFFIPFVMYKAFTAPQTSTTTKHII